MASRATTTRAGSVGDLGAPWRVAYTSTLSHISDQSTPVMSGEASAYISNSTHNNSTTHVMIFRMTMNSMASLVYLLSLKYPTHTITSHSFRLHSISLICDHHNTFGIYSCQILYL